MRHDFHVNNTTNYLLRMLGNITGIIALYISIVSVHILGDYSEDDIYHYAASSTYQNGGGSPPPPAPPSPPSHAYIPSSHHQLEAPYSRGRRQEKSFNAIVYKQPSLYEVDSQNLNSPVQKVSKIPFHAIIVLF